ncbi:MAG: recombinase family protein [Planctomycetota bacterium]|nr:recombinase family protein [Planctomycetota bacterium]
MKHKTDKQRKAAAYIRAFPAAGKISLERQRRKLTRLAKRALCEIVEWYEDQFAVGDSIEDRPAFCRMLLDGRKGLFEVILCDHQRRFGRLDLVNEGLFISPLRNAGVRMLTTAQGWAELPIYAGRCTSASLPQKPRRSRGTVRKPSVSCGKTAVFWISHSLPPDDC